jgi:hypothetical protein
VRAAIAWLALVLGGCAPVHPWERGRLLTPVMAEPWDGLCAETTNHVRTTREAMMGADPAGGASCGCN